MRNQQLRNKVIWGIAAIAALSLCYALSRHDVLGKWHLMVELPRNLFILGIIVIGTAAFFCSRLVMSSTVIGHMAGFVLAMLFNNDYAGPGDSPGVMSYNNAWIIWIFTYIAIIVTAIIWEVIDMFLSKQNTEAA